MYNLINSPNRIGKYRKNLLFKKRSMLCMAYKHTFDFWLDIDHAIQRKIQVFFCFHERGELRVSISTVKINGY